MGGRGAGGCVGSGRTQALRRDGQLTLTPTLGQQTLCPGESRTHGGHCLSYVTALQTPSAPKYSSRLGTPLNARDEKQQEETGRWEPGWREAGARRTAAQALRPPEGPLRAEAPRASGGGGCACLVAVRRVPRAAFSRPPLPRPSLGLRLVPHARSLIQRDESEGRGRAGQEGEPGRGRPGPGLGGRR